MVERVAVVGCVAVIDGSTVLGGPAVVGCVAVIGGSTVLGCPAVPGQLALDGSTVPGGSWPWSRAWP